MPSVRFLLPLLASLIVACAAHDDAATSDERLESPDAPLAAPPGCTTITTATSPLATATSDGEMILTVDAQALSATSWADQGNEAVVLEVLDNGARLGHLILHQGADRFTYGMHTGALKAGDQLSIRVSPLTAPRANKTACIQNVVLAAPAANMAEGVQHAPIVKWPTEQVFNNTPVLLGWSRGAQSYQLTYTNEDGGTAALCGGGARGMRSEIARWGRGLDMEGVFAYGGAGMFERCTGSVPLAPGVPNLTDAHPHIYLGSSHNTVFESRGGYGQACGTSSDKEADGKENGWNTNNPGNDESLDDPFTVVLRPIPVDLDAVGYREDIVNAYAPWLYRLTDGELKREGKIDNAMTFSMERYLFVDVYANDVGGSGDETCGPDSSFPSITHVSGGFRLNVVTKDGNVAKGPQMTASYFGSTVKRIAVPLEAGTTIDDIDALVFDAYDNDGIYFMGIGPAFIATASGSNGATLQYLNPPGAIKKAETNGVYVDDDNSGCVNGVNTDATGAHFPCEGSVYTMKL